MAEVEVFLNDFIEIVELAFGAEVTLQRQESSEGLGPGLSQSLDILSLG